MRRAPGARHAMPAAAARARASVSSPASRGSTRAARAPHPARHQPTDQKPYDGATLLGETVVAADGTCTVISNNVPRPGLILAGCTLRVVNPPAGIVGGVATSMSVFNPLQLSGFGTGSFWTLRLYTTD